jgi:trk system potassium uptake protein TrkH
MTTTGYATIDFNNWATFPKTVMVMVMFVGACAGSTGGGMKVSRWILYFKQVIRGMQQFIHPRSVKNIRLEGKIVDDETLKTTNLYFMAYAFVFIFSLILISLDGFDFTTSFTAITATINNIGPGLNVVGPAGNFAGFSNLSKWVMSFDMIAGRLEMFPMLILLAPSTWKKS